MSGSSPHARQAGAEQHLGDRLAALVDGELGHDERERVLAHLATCARCKAEADCQRRLKTVFAEVAPPPPSEGFLARLQGLPGGPPAARRDNDDHHGGLLDVPGLADGVLEARSLDLPGLGAGGFSYLPAAAGGEVPAVPARHGFPVHELRRPGAARQDSERSWRGRRFAFAAASAVSFAAMALGGAVPGLGTAADAPAAPGPGNNVLPLRAPGGGTPATPAAQPGRRQGRNGSAGGAASSVQAQVMAVRSFTVPSSVLSALPADVWNTAHATPSAAPTGSVQQAGAADASAGRPAGSVVTPRPSRLVAPVDPLAQHRRPS